MNIFNGNVIIKKLQAGIIIAIRNESYDIKKFINPMNFKSYQGLVANFNCFSIRYRNIKPKFLFSKFKIDIPHKTFKKEMGII